MGGAYLELEASKFWYQASDNEAKQVLATCLDVLDDT